MKTTFYFLISFLFLLAYPLNKSFGAYHCVQPDGSGETSLQGALTASQTSGESDVIQVIQGIYYGNFTYTSGESYCLTLLGGYSSGCTSRTLDPSNTVLDAGESGRVLDFTSSAGGGMMVQGLTIQNGNVSGLGGGVKVYSYNFSDASDLGDITFTQNIICNNQSDDQGGGLRVRSGSSSGTSGDIIFTDNTISGNTTYSDGGGVWTFTSGETAGSITFTNNTITNNNCTLGIYGGLTAYSNLKSSTGGDITLKGNTITGNSAYQSGGGAGVETLSSSATSGMIILVNNVIAKNNTSYSSGGGGGINVAASSFSGVAGDIAFTNNTISENTSAGNGGGIQVSMENNNVHVYNNIIRGNTAVGSGSDIILVGTGTAYGYNNNYAYLFGSWSGESDNINANPHFVGTGDYHLQSSSPCIGTGLNSAPSIPDDDIDGDTRISGGTVDIGADEYISKGTLSFLMLLLN